MRARIQSESAEKLTRAAFAAVGAPRTHAVPYSVHEADVLREQQAAEARVVGEISRVRPLPDPDCKHPNLSALRSLGTYGDLATHFGHCPTCDDYFVVTEYANGEIESRPMTSDEQTRYATAEDRRSRNEWLEDFQAGAE